MDNDERQARLRVSEACRLITSAYRLYPLRPQETIDSVKTAIVIGMERMAEDITEETREAS
jgi:hypothetical protein